MVNDIRQKHPRIGTRKLYQLIKPSFEELSVKVGRDRLFTLLSENNMLIRKRKRSVRTTYSNHIFRKYPNLVKDFEPKAPNQLWVSDITYIKTKSGFVYLYLITDAYSRKVVAHTVSDNLEAVNTIKCLQQALQHLSKPIPGLIHHSDRGIQYCTHEYIHLLQEYDVMISMTENGDPKENAIAERVNGILKEEYLNHQTFINLIDTRLRVAEVVELYNTLRPHLSVDMMTPVQAHNQQGKLKRLWKSNYKVNFIEESFTSSKLIEDFEEVKNNVNL